MPPERDAKARWCLQKVRAWWLCDSHCLAHSRPVAVGHMCSVTCVVAAREVAAIQDPPVGRWEGMEWPGGMLESVLGLMNSRLWAVSLLSLRFCNTRLSASQANRACLDGEEG